MKKIKSIILLLLAAFSFASCMDSDWEDPKNDYAYGNDNIEESNVVTIAELKDMYSNVLNVDYRDGVSYAEVDKDVKIKGVVTGNDIQGNLYNQISLQDESGAIVVAISSGGLNGYLPVGAEILVDLKGLYVGNYGLQPEIGTPYTNANGQTYVSRMNRVLWNQHFKYTGVTKTVTPEVFDLAKVTDENYLKANAGKLMVVKGVTLADADGVTVYAEGNTINQALQGISANNLVLRTSNYADFAAKKLPMGTLAITGVFTRFNSTWQILVRSEDDIRPY
jgi:hypothetical protein